MKTEISKSTKLKPGDMIELHFSTPGPTFFDRIVGYIIEKKLRANKNYDVYNWKFTPDTAIYYVRIIEPEDPEYYTATITPAIIGYAIIGIMGFLAFAWTLQKIYKITESPAGGIALGVGGAIVILFLIKTLRT